MEHQCPLCNSDLQIAKSTFKAEQDDSPDTPTEIYSVLDMVCVNPKCPNFSGVDLDNPKTIVEIVKNKVN